MEPRERYQDTAKTAPTHDDDAAHSIQSGAAPDFAEHQDDRSFCIEEPAVERSSILDGLTELIGEEAADKIIEKFGGTRLYVPHLPKLGDVLTGAVGNAAAQRLAQAFGGDRVEVPNPPPRRTLIVHLRRAGLSVAAIARAVHCTRRRVFQILAEARTVQAED